MKRLAQTAEWIVAVFGGFIGLVLLVEKIFFSFDGVSHEYVFNMGQALLGGAIYIILFFLICVSGRIIRSEHRFIAANIVITIMFEILFCLSIIMGSRIYFTTDAGAVYNLAVQFLNGDYSAIMPKDSYLSFYPQQYGMIFVFEWIMRIFRTTNGKIFQLMNIALIVFGTMAGYGIVWKMIPRRTSVIAYGLLQITFFPLFFFSAIAYGDLPATCLTLVAVYLLIQVFEAQKYRILWMLLATIAIVLDCIFKKNALVCLIAIVLVSMVMLLKKFDVKKALWLLFTIFLAMMSVPSIQKMYEIQSGRESGKGMPMITYIAMSMQEGLGAPGAWSGYHTDLFMQNDYDYDATSEQAREDIRKSVAAFVDDPGYMLEFYTQKVAYQWTEGSFDGIGWGVANAFGEKKSSWVQNILNGPAHAVFMRIANWHQCVVYLAFALSMIFFVLDLKKRKPLSFGKMVLIVIVIGGFLFELIWESSSRYVMMYYAMMLPVAAEATARAYESYKRK